MGILVTWPVPSRYSVRPPSSREPSRSEEHTSELQSQSNLVCRLLLEKKKKKQSDSATAKSILRHRSPTPPLARNSADQQPLHHPHPVHQPTSNAPAPDCVHVVRTYPA